MVVLRGDVKAVGDFAAAVSQHPGIFVEIARRVERPVHPAQFYRRQHVAIGPDRARTTRIPPKATKCIAPERDLGRDCVGCVQMHRRDIAEIAHSRIICAFSVFQPAKRFGHQEVQIRIAFTMGVGRAVDRHVVNEIGDIGAVVEVEAARQKLVGLALAAVDGDDQTRHRFQQFADAIGGTQVDFFAGNCTHAGSCCNAEQILARRGYNDLAGWVTCGCWIIGRRTGRDRENGESHAGGAVRNPIAIQTHFVPPRANLSADCIKSGNAQTHTPDAQPRRKLWFIPCGRVHNRDGPPDTGSTRPAMPPPAASW